MDLFEKYLYWFHPDEPTFRKEVMRREMYSRIGYFFHLVQMAEYNIASILSIDMYEKEYKTVFTVDKYKEITEKVAESFEEFSSKKFTFGVLAKRVETSSYLKDLDPALLKDIVEFRNYLAHRCFKEKLLDGSLKTEDEVDKFVDELNDYEVKAAELNKHLASVFEGNKTKSILLQV